MFVCFSIDVGHVYRDRRPVLLVPAVGRCRRLMTVAFTVGTFVGSLSLSAGVVGSVIGGASEAEQARGTSTMG